jgi:hypothetical protein
MSLKQIAQNPTLVENLFGPAADMGAALINDHDWFENDGLLEKIPYGKIVAWVIKKAVEIRDVDKAFNHAYSLAYFLCFSQAVKRYKVFLKGIDLVEINDQRQTEELFPLENDKLVKSKIFTHYTSKYRSLLEACNITDETIGTIQNYIHWNLRIAFRELLENKPTTYKKLCDELEKTSFLLSNKKLQIIHYYQEQKNLFLLPVMGDEQGMTLEKVYIEPKYRIHKISIEEAKIKKDFKKSEYEDTERLSSNVFVEPKAKAYNHIHGLLNDFVSGNTIKDKIKCPNTRTLVLLGYPGQGKTSCIRKLLFDFIKDVENPELVYHLPLRSIENVPNFCNAPFEIIEEHIKSKNLPDDYAKDLVQNGTIILEGLDELAIQSGTKEKTIDEVVRELLRVQENRKEVKLIITSRLGYLDCNQFAKKNLVIVQLKEFDKQQQLDWLKKYKKFYPQCKITLKNIQQFNKSDHHLKELINQPILLHMVVSSGIEITSNTNRAKLYELLFNSLIERKWATEKKEDESNDKQIELLKGLDSFALREIIQDMALAIFQSGKNCIQKKEIEELDGVENQITRKLGFDKLGGALKGVMVAFYFQEVEKKEENGNHDFGIEFLHKSLSEYMAAEKIWKEIKVFLERRTSQRRYEIDSLKKALEMLNNLFAPQMLTLEVRDYIWEIMENDIDFDAEELSERLSYFLPELLRKEYLGEYDSGKHDYPIKRALSTFYGYWTVLSKLAMRFKRDYLNSEIKDDFVRVLRSCLLSYPPHVTLSYQTLSETNLSGANLSRTNLSGADLSRANLSRANLYKADLSGAILSGAILFRATLFGTNLSSANLDGADLFGAILLEANLYRTNFSGANLGGADLCRAYLSGANFSGANLSRVNLDGVNLDGVNLDGATLSGANFLGCFMDEKNYKLLKEKGVDLTGVNIIKEEKI